MGTPKVELVGFLRFVSRCSRDSSGPTYPSILSGTVHAPELYWWADMVSSSPRLSHATERHPVSFLSKGEGHVRFTDLGFFKEAVFVTCIRYHSNKKHSFEANETLYCSPATVHSNSKHGEMRRLLPHDEIDYWKQTFTICCSKCCSTVGKDMNHEERGETQLRDLYDFFSAY